MFNHTFLSQSLRKAMMALAVVMISLSAVWAQNVKVTGTVTDNNGEPMIGVYVLVQGTTNGTSTDLDGKYSLNAASDATLVFSYMGYTDKVEAVNGRQVVNVTMSQDAVLLEDVVVTALGIKKERKALGYAIQDVKADELMKNMNSPLATLSWKIFFTQEKKSLSNWASSFKMGAEMLKIIFSLSFALLI